MLLIEKIKGLSTDHTLSKQEQIIQGVILSIEKGDLTIGNQLPSINKMVREIGYARKTIVKAYEELKNRGLIGSKKLKGYYIISLETHTTLKIALLLYAFQSFHEDFYNSFRKELGKHFHIDVFFHHNNNTVFETILTNIMGKYGKYVIAPIQTNEVKIRLRDTIPSHKLLIVDRYLNLGSEYSFISQEFENAMYQKLVELLDNIPGYTKLVLLVNEESDYTPIGTLRAFDRFLRNHNIEGSIERSYVPDSAMKGTLYFILNDSILWQVLSDCVRLNYTVGKDIGILSHNDNLAKKISFGGITTISTDFKEMGKMAAVHIKNKEITQVIMPFDLIRRKSL